MKDGLNKDAALLGEYYLLNKDKDETLDSPDARLNKVHECLYLHIIAISVHVEWCIKKL